MARCIPPVWIRGGCPESGRVIHRAEDLVGDSGATFKVIVPIHAAQPTAARGMASSDANLSDPLRLLRRACRDIQVQESARREGSPGEDVQPPEQGMACRKIWKSLEVLGEFSCRFAGPRSMKI